MYRRIVGPSTTDIKEPPLTPFAQSPVSPIYMKYDQCCVDFKPEKGKKGAPSNIQQRRMTFMCW